MDTQSDHRMELVKKYARALGTLQGQCINACISIDTILEFYASEMPEHVVDKIAKIKNDLCSAEAKAVEETR